MWNFDTKIIGIFTRKNMFPVHIMALFFKFLNKKTSKHDIYYTDFVFYTILFINDKWKTG